MRTTTARSARAARWSVLALALWAVAATAAPVRHLFQAQVPVTDHSAEQRSGGIRAAFEEVLVRLTGQSDVTQLPAAQDLLKQPGRFLQQYRYRRHAPADTTKDATPLWLWVRFDGRALEQAVRRAGLPLWGRERPRTLIWLAVEDNGRRYLVSSDDDNDVRARIEQDARRRGVPVLFPLMDLEDQRKVQFADVWGGFLDVVVDASKRYNTPNVLVGRLQHTASGSWNARWSMELDNQEHNWQVTDSSLDKLLAAGVNGAAERLASRLAVRPGAGGEQAVSLTVEGVHSLQDYSRVTHYLSSLTPVQNLAVTRLDGGRLGLSLQLEGDPGTLDQYLALGEVLNKVPDSPQRVYRLRP